MNPVQTAGAMSTYGRRYTFIAGFGVVIEDEDTDATFDDGVKYADYINAMQSENDLDSLHELCKASREQLRKDGDMRGIEIVTAVRPADVIVHISAVQPVLLLLARAEKGGPRRVKDRHLAIQASRRMLR